MEEPSMDNSLERTKGVEVSRQLEPAGHHPSRAMVTTPMQICICSSFHPLQIPSDPRHADPGNQEGPRTAIGPHRLNYNHRSGPFA